MKKSLAFILAAVMLLSMLPALAFAEDCEGHNPEKVEAQAGNCGDAGWDAYWHCEKCDKYYADNNGVIGGEIPQIPEIAPTGNHTSENGTAATCTSKAICGVCGKEYGEKIAHSPEKQDGTAADCVNPGFKDAYKCSACNNYFADEGCTEAIQDYSAWIAKGGAGYIAPLGHDGEEKTEGDNTYYECKREGCGYSWVVVTLDPNGGNFYDEYTDETTNTPAADPFTFNAERNSDTPNDIIEENKPAVIKGPSGKVLSTWTTVKDDANTALDKKPEGGTDTIGETELIGNTTFYALYVNEVTINYVVESNTVASDKAGEGEKITLKAEPEKIDGKKFTGWVINNTDYAAGSEFTVPAGSDTITATAKFLSTYMVTFDAKGGEGTFDDQEVVSGEKATEPTSAPTKEGYKFKGWYEANAQDAFDFNTPITKTTVLSAEWSQVFTVEVTGGKAAVINKNSPSYGATVEAAAGDTIGIKPDDTSLFQKWESDVAVKWAGSESESTTNSSSVTTFTMPAQDVNLTAKNYSEDSENTVIKTGENEGDKGVFIKNSGDYTVVFKKDYDSSTFKKVILTGTKKGSESTSTLLSTKYSVAKGSTIVTLKESVLNDLDTYSTATLQILTEDGFSKTATIEIKNPLTITDPADKKVYCGKSAAFSVTAGGGDETYFFQWQYKPSGKDWVDINDGQVLYNGRNTSSATDDCVVSIETDKEKSTLTLNYAVCKVDASRFRCIVSDGHDTMVTSGEAKLNVVRMGFKSYDKYSYICTNCGELDPKVKTGDVNSPALWAALAGTSFLALVSCGVVYAVRKKKQ